MKLIIKEIFDKDSLELRIKVFAFISDKDEEPSLLININTRSNSVNTIRDYFINDPSITSIEIEHLEPSDFKGFVTAELRALAKDYHISGFADISREDLIDKIIRYLNHKKFDGDITPLDFLF